uniref:glycosyltransferase n=1 Tax=Flavobacterium sp. TaxID=239 RepID=UPI00404A957F
MVRTVDDFFSSNNYNVIAQIGITSYKPKNINYKDFYLPDEIDLYFDTADVIISHAGMGTIINCIKKSKPLILLPRLSVYGEHRNDHQIDTIKSFTNLKGIYIANDEIELQDLLYKIDSLDSPEEQLDTKCKELISFINNYYFS